MAYTDYDTPGEFFNISPTATAYDVTAATLSLGLADHATAGNRFLTNLTAAQAAVGGSLAQVIFGIFNGIYSRFQTIKLLSSAHAPTKFNITRNGYTDETTGEMVYTFNCTIRVTPGDLVAVNS